MRILAQTVWLVLLGTWSNVALAESHHHPPSVELSAEPPSTDSLYHLKATWTAEDGKPFVLSSSRGQVVVLAMVYTSCGAVCPLIVADMQAIEGRLPESLRPKVRFLLVSFDPERDTPAKLRTYAESRHLDSNRWTLLSGRPDDVRDLAAVLGMKYKRSENGDFVHSSLISVLDRDGVVRYQQHGAPHDPAEAAAVIQRLSASP